MAKKNWNMVAKRNKLRDQRIEYMAEATFKAREYDNSHLDPVARLSREAQQALVDAMVRDWHNATVKRLHRQLAQRARLATHIGFGLV